MPSRIPVFFFEEDIAFKPKNKAGIREWIKETVTAEGFKLKELNYIFCPDSYLIEINRQYLNHDTYTDIITFDNSEKEGIIVGDIFISVDRIRENAAKFATTEANELHRVIYTVPCIYLAIRINQKQLNSWWPKRKTFTSPK